MLSVGEQCRLRRSRGRRSTTAPQGETARNLDFMLLIDKQFLDTPFYGVRQDDTALAERGPCREPETHPAADASHAPDADLPEADTSKPRRGTRPTPICLRGGLRTTPQSGLVRRNNLSAERKGFQYLVAIMDWLHPKVLGLAHLQHAGSRLLASRR